ncbi:HK97 family phage prohead protease [Candidatus Nesciobacter abundans]|uniref:HK97 family phage prohead protease n=1 Tax=Candidatus Nesciobacter abundans TaxID=2601668 RepID=A0A5C0UHK2_9PROT|nr:HK97 family phage prohead protease [Candidatus Nesciobacter abundans]QEK39043.1 HK97 family phage prohead protease [Candidatus Nesciobacter abundans]
MRALSSGLNENEFIVQGYASTFNFKDGQSDIIKPGAFDSKKIDIPKIKMLWKHDIMKPIGYWYEMFEDECGLFVKGKVFRNLSFGEQICNFIKHSFVKGLSIGYIPTSFQTFKNCRIISKLKLYEISVVTNPANEKAKII